MKLTIFGKLLSKLIDSFLVILCSLSGFLILFYSLVQLNKILRNIKSLKADHSTLLQIFTSWATFSRLSFGRFSWLLKHEKTIWFLIGFDFLKLLWVQWTYSILVFKCNLVGRNNLRCLIADIHHNLKLLLFLSQFLVWLFAGVVFVLLIPNF